MKNLLLTFITLATLSVSAFAQRTVYVDTDKILNNIPQYQAAQSKIDEVADGWRAEVDKRYKEIDQLYRDYQNNEVFYTDDIKKQKQAEIESMEKAVKDYQKQKFGYKGEMFTQKQELIKPIQDMVYKEIKKLAQEKSYDMVLDKSAGVTMLYANPKYDITSDVLKALGIQITSESK